MATRKYARANPGFEHLTFDQLREKQNSLSRELDEVKNELRRRYGPYYGERSQTQFAPFEGAGGKLFGAGWAKHNRGQSARTNPNQLPSEPLILTQLLDNLNSAIDELNIWNATHYYWQVSSLMTRLELEPPTRLHLDDLSAFQRLNPTKERFNRLVALAQRCINEYPKLMSPYLGDDIPGDEHIVAEHQAFVHRKLRDMRQQVG